MVACTISTSPNPSVYGQPITVTVSVTPGAGGQVAVTNPPCAWAASQANGQAQFIDFTSIDSFSYSVVPVVTGGGNSGPAFFEACYTGLVGVVQQSPALLRQPPGPPPYTHQVKSS